MIVMIAVKIMMMVIIVIGFSECVKSLMYYNVVVGSSGPTNTTVDQELFSDENRLSWETEECLSASQLCLVCVSACPAVT